MSVVTLPEPAPTFPDSARTSEDVRRSVIPGSKLWIEVDAVEPWGNDLIGAQVLTGTKNFTQKFWVGWGAVRAVVHPNGKIETVPAGGTRA